MKKSSSQQKLILPKIGVNLHLSEPQPPMKPIIKNQFRPNKNITNISLQLNLAFPDQSNQNQENYSARGKKNRFNRDFQQSMKSLHSKSDFQSINTTINQSQQQGLNQFLHRGETSLNLLNSLQTAKSHQTEQSLDFSNIPNLHVKRQDINSQQKSRNVFNLTSLESQNTTNYTLPNANMLNLCNLKNIDKSIQQNQSDKQFLQNQQQIIDQQQKQQQQSQKSSKKQQRIKKSSKSELNKDQLYKIEQYNKQDDILPQNNENEQDQSNLIPTLQSSQSNHTQVSKINFLGGKQNFLLSEKEKEKAFKLDDLIEDLIQFNNTQKEFHKMQQEQEVQKQKEAQQLQNLLKNDDDDNLDSQHSFHDDEHILSFTKDDPEPQPQKVQNELNPYDQKMQKMEEEFHKRFQKITQIRADDMVYNVKQLLRLQKLREQKIYKNLIQTEEMMEYIRKKNQIQILLENSKNIKNLKQIAVIIESEISKQNQKISGIVDILLKKFQLQEFAQKITK